MITAIQPYSIRTNRSKPIQKARINQISFSSNLPKINEENLILFRKLTDLMTSLTDKYRNSKNFFSNDNIHVDVNSEGGIHLGFNDKKAEKMISVFKHSAEKDTVFIRVIDGDKNIRNNYSQQTYKDGINESFIIKDGENNFGDIDTYMNDHKWRFPLSDYEIDMTGKYMTPEFVNQFNERVSKYLPEITNRIDEFKKLAGI